jgi:hypothetical protein
MQAPPLYLLLQSKRYLQLACKGFEAHIQAPCSGAGPCTSVWQKGDVAYRQVLCVCVCARAHMTLQDAALLRAMLQYTTPCNAMAHAPGPAPRAILNMKHKYLSLVLLKVAM